MIAHNIAIQYCIELFLTPY